MSNSRTVDVIKIDIDMPYCTISVVLDLIKLRIRKFVPKLEEIIDRINHRQSTSGNIHVFVVLKRGIPEIFATCIALILGGDINKFKFNFIRWRYIGTTLDRMFICKRIIDDQILRKFLRVYYVECRRE